MSPALVTILPILFIPVVLAVQWVTVRRRTFFASVALVLAGFVLASTPYAVDLRRARHMGGEGAQSVADVTSSGGGTR